MASSTDDASDLLAVGSARVSAIASVHCLIEPFDSRSSYGYIVSYPQLHSVHNRREQKATLVTELQVNPVM
jgi:hypothetical protein